MKANNAELSKTYGIILAVMTDGTNSPEQQHDTPQYRTENFHYGYGRVVMRLTAEEGTKYEFGRNRDSMPREDADRYDPVRKRDNEGVISTSSGDYLITHDMSHVYDKTGNKILIVDIGESQKRGELVAAITERSDTPLPPVEFGKPWKIPGFAETSDVNTLLLAGSLGVGPYMKKVEGPNPFKIGHDLLHKHQTDFELKKLNLHQITAPDQHKP